MQPFTGNGDAPNERKITEWDEKPQTNKQTKVFRYSNIRLSYKEDRGNVAEIVFKE